MGIEKESGVENAPLSPVVTILVTLFLILFDSLCLVQSSVNCLLLVNHNINNHMIIPVVANTCCVFILYKACSKTFSCINLCNLHNNP